MIRIIGTLPSGSLFIEAITLPTLIPSSVCALPIPRRGKASFQHYHHYCYATLYPPSGGTGLRSSTSGTASPFGGTYAVQGVRMRHRVQKLKCAKPRRTTSHTLYPEGKAFSCITPITADLPPVLLRNPVPQKGGNGALG